MIRRSHCGVALLALLAAQWTATADVEMRNVVVCVLEPHVGAIAEPTAVPIIKPLIDLVAPRAAAHVPPGAPITFEWGASKALDVTVMIFPGTEIVDDNPARVFYQLPAGTTSATLPCVNGCGDFAQLGFAALPPGEYVWYVVGNFGSGDRCSQERRLTIACPADLDNDGDFANGLTGDGAVTIEDLLSFLVGFEAGNVLVDLDNGTSTGTPDNAVDINDLLFFLVRFEDGC